MTLRRRLLLGVVAIGLVASATVALIFGVFYDYRLQTQSPPTSGPFDGQRLVAAEVIGHRLLPGTELAIGFDAGSFGIDAGCNAISGGYAVRAGRVRTPVITQTSMGCLRPGLEEQDEWAAALLDGARVDRHGDRLILHGDDTTITLVPRLDTESPDAVVGHWQLTSLLDARSTRRLNYRSSGGEHAALTLSDRVATASMACGDQLSASVRHEAAAVIFEQRWESWQPPTSGPCRARQARVHAALRSALSGRAEVRRTGDQLTLTRGATVLRFKRLSS